VQLPDSENFGEPSIILGPEGNLYIAAPGSATNVWRSGNGGFAWQRVADSLGNSGDSDIATDALGRLYASDLFSDVPVSVSTDQGASFDYKTATANGGSNDRQWLAARADGLVWSSWRDGSTERVARSSDAGHTYQRAVAATNVGLQGNIVATSDTELWIPYQSGNGIFVAHSIDAGATWTQHRAAFVGGTLNIFPGMAVDQHGTIYVVWPEAHVPLTGIASGTVQYHIHIATSHDGGLTWTAPATLADSHYNIMPWVIADAPGHVAIAWYEGEPPLNVLYDPTYAPLTAWFVHVAYSQDADAASPTWSHTRATGVMHSGPICTNGTGCIPIDNPIAGNRALLDFFEIAEKPNGDIAITYAGDISNTGATALFAVVQGAGPNLKG
jgi:hypothetical protein